MRLRTLALALAAGVAAFLAVGVAVTELLAARIEFSVFVGLPAGLLAGLATTALVALGLGRGGAGRRVAAAAGAFGGAFLVTLLGVALVGGTGVLVAMGVGGAVGLVVGAGTYWRFGRTVCGEPPAEESV